MRQARPKLECCTEQTLRSLPAEALTQVCDQGAPEAVGDEQHGLPGLRLGLHVEGEGAQREAHGRARQVGPLPGPRAARAPVPQAVRGDRCGCTGGAGVGQYIIEVSATCQHFLKGQWLGGCQDTGRLESRHAGELRAA